MDWDSYRRLCDRGDVITRYLLEATADLLETADEAGLAQQLRGVLAGAPLQQPTDHRAGAAADCFLVTFEPEVARRILAVVSAARSAGQRTSSGRHLGGFVEAWQEYLAWQTGEHPRSPATRPAE